MGSTLGPSLANAFLSYHEKNWLNSCLREFKPAFYRRYVDDIFVLFKSIDHLKYFPEFLNSCHINMSLSMETERQNKFSFLYIEVIREKGKFSTTVYCKPTLKVFYLLFVYLVWYAPLVYRCFRKYFVRIVILKTLLISLLKSF